MLLKNVIQAIPLYMMHVFLLPSELVKEIERVMNVFWWGREIRGRKGIRWKAWHYLYVPKKWGGMGFQRLEDFNVAMLSKQSWRLIQRPSSLVARIYKVKYYPNCSFFEAKKGGNPSFIWSNLLETHGVIRGNNRWRVGDGNSIQIWGDFLLPNQNNALVTTAPFPYLENARVLALFNMHGNEWDEDNIRDIFVDKDVDLIMSIPLSTAKRNDKLIWKNEDNGIFTVKSCYRAIVGNANMNEVKPWTTMWNLKIPPKVKTSFWQACSSCIATPDLLQIKHVYC